MILAATWRQIPSTFFRSRRSSFLEKSSAISEFHTALGQFINYRGALRRRQPERILYLAVPLTTYKTFFQLDFPQRMFEKSNLLLALATRSRGYKDKTHLRGLKTLIFR